MNKKNLKAGIYTYTGYKYVTCFVFLVFPSAIDLTRPVVFWMGLPYLLPFCTAINFITGHRNVKWLAVYVWYQIQNVSLHRFVLCFFLMTSSNENIFRVTGLWQGNSSVTGGFPHKRYVTWNFNVFLDLRLNQRLKNNGEACDLTLHRARYDATVMCFMRYAFTNWLVPCYLWKRWRIYF